MFCIEEGMVISPVGSCSTLVAQQIIAKSPCVLESNVASLLYGTIILDTVNFNEIAKRGTKEDLDVVEHLQTCLPVTPNRYSF